MTNAPVELIERVLRQTLGPYGFDYAKVRVAPDHGGDEALFIDAVLKPKSALVGGEASSEAQGALSAALLAHGEFRFPFMFIRHPDDEPAEPPTAPTQATAP